MSSTKALETFRVKINGAPSRRFVASTGVYKYAALAAVLDDASLLPLPGQTEAAISVEIWCEALPPDQGPFRYLIWEDATIDGQIYVTPANALSRTSEG